MAHRQRVEKFIGDEDRRAGRNLVEALACQVAVLPLSASVARCALRAGRWLRRDATSIAAKNSGAARAARKASAISAPRPGPSSTRRIGGGRADLAPDFRRPQADQFAEHLRDFRRGDEIAVGAERIAVV